MVGERRVSDTLTLFEDCVLSQNFVKSAMHVGHAGTGEREMRFVRRAGAEEVQKTVEALDNDGPVLRSSGKLLPVTAQQPAAIWTADQRHLICNASGERTGSREGFARCAFVENDGTLGVVSPITVNAGEVTSAGWSGGSTGVWQATSPTIASTATAEIVFIMPPLEGGTEYLLSVAFTAVSSSGGRHTGASVGRRGQHRPPSMT